MTVMTTQLADSIALQILAAESKGQLALSEFRNADANEFFIDACDMVQQLGYECGKARLEMPIALEASPNLVDMFQDTAQIGWDEVTELCAA